MRFGGEPLKQCGGEPRLANACFARQEHYLAFAILWIYCARILPFEDRFSDSRADSATLRWASPRKSGIVSSTT